ncbi:HAD-IA family hydrolase [Candidatus Woesearchaeota archaeon]|nr:HAD-IA family hydrolase [Candidatus Woesearchaeota archaeon]
MIKIVIFDFDGVIVNSTKHNIDFANQMLKHFGKPELSRGDEKDAYTMTSREFYNKYLYDVGIIRSLFFMKRLFKKTLNEFKATKHLNKLLKILKKKYKLAIVTNRAGETYEILEYLGLRDNFDLILTVEHIKKPKPSPEGIKKVLKYFTFKPSEAVYIGDTSFDSLAAKRAGVISIILKNRKDGGDYKIKDLFDIKGILEKFK